MTEMEEIKTMLADINKKLDKVIFQNKIALNTKYGSPIKQDKEEKKTMTKNEQIDRIFGVIDLWASNAVIHNFDRASVYNPYNAKELAVELYNAGYRKIDDDYFDVITKAELKQYKVQAIKEFAEKLKSGLRNCTGCYIPNCFERATDEFAYSEKDLLKLIDNLLKEYEKCGVEEKE